MPVFQSFVTITLIITSVTVLWLIQATVVWEKFFVEKLLSVPWYDEN